MDMDEIKVGDHLFWNDPDGKLCSCGVVVVEKDEVIVFCEEDCGGWVEACPEELSTERREHIEPFSNMRVEIEDIDFNLDGLEGDELEEKVEELPTSGVITLYSRELFDLGILDNGKNGKWVIDLGNLRDYVEERISSDTDTLLNDFNFSYTVSD